MSQTLLKIIDGQSPVIAAAIHDGHKIDSHLIDLLSITDEERLREEDPYTGLWTSIAKTQIVGINSRFQVDLNRPREKAVYVTPEDSWGLKVWHKEPDINLINRALKEYDQIYSTVFDFLSKVERQFGRFIVLDMHSYNHRREGPNGTEAPAKENPEINIGTGSVNKQLWGTVVDRFIRELSSCSFQGRKLDVRENIKFFGGRFPRWIHENFPDTGCAIAVEVKKIFMDEWTGQLDQYKFNEISQALESTIPGLFEGLKDNKI